MLSAPFTPLVVGGEGLEHPPAAPFALRARMAAIYGVREREVLPVRGALHAAALMMRRVALDGSASVVAPRDASFVQLARLSRIELTADWSPGAGALWIDRGGVTADTARARSAAIAPAHLIVDESWIEFSERESLCAVAVESGAMLVLRSLEYAYGLAGAPVAALIGSADLIATYENVVEPCWLPAPLQTLALAALDPTRLVASERRIESVRAERARIAQALNAAESVEHVEAREGPFLLVAPRVQAAAAAALRRHEARGAWVDGGRFRIDVAAPEINDRALAAFGVAAPTRARRSAEVVRETAETRIVACVDLDAVAAPQVVTGVGFFDHMLQQVAHHGGFALTLACAGDLSVDAHHSIEDCALALGQALKQALGARRGIARFGFVAPMDEAEAKVSVDLGGRPYLVFEGAFAAAALGAYPTEMTEHVFRSLAQSMGAAIHVAVRGDNDHHKTEACFKAFGRALRQAVREEGEAIPSTKGVL